uniref:Uncharacterized protein n=1 Tax=Ananas comosus var. bracteatus TaxID=296719 RepID=A0A6V7P9D2_ANACO|nr:unnamed protein product [Ananas comosus var. bracteatus]
MASEILHKMGIKPKPVEPEIQFDCNWADVTCPICLDFPHNAVLLRCSSYEKGCRPFMCDTDQSLSNCLERFKSAYGLPGSAKSSAAAIDTSLERIQIVLFNPNSRPTCPLCRGEVIGWAIVDEARLQLNQKRRCCEENNCSYFGDFYELQKHTQIKHPNSHPSEIDPKQRLDWENFQQSSDIIDVLSTIHAEVPHGVVLGDYVIEYGDEEDGDEYEDFNRVRRNWWTACIFSRVCCRASRNRSQSRVRERRGGSERRSSRRSSYDNSNLEEGPARSVDIGDYRFDEIVEEFVGTGSVASRRLASQYRDSFGRYRIHSH